MKDWAIASCRVSTPEQLENRSIQRQEENVRRAADELNVELIKGWSLDQSSRAGKNIKRKDLQEMLEFCNKNKRVKYVIVDEVDRFMRGIREFYYFEQQFINIGVTPYYASQPALNSDDIGAKIQKLLAILGAEMSNDERQRKTTSGLKTAVSLGYYPFPVKQGYRKTFTPGLHEPDPVRFELLQTALIEVASGEFTAHAALKRLNANGYATPSGKTL